MTSGNCATTEGRAEIDARRRERTEAIFRALWPASAIVAAVAAQAGGSLADDISGLITLSEKMLNGETPYVDFVEVNPPASILIYLPIVAMARLLGVAPEFLIGLCCFLAIGATLWLCTRALRNTGLIEGAGPIGLAAAIAALAVLPAHVFAQREHIAVIAGLPFFCALIARASGADVEAPVRLLAGLGAGLMMSIKPHFALTILATLPYLVRRIGWRATLGLTELYVGGFVCALYGAAIALFFPAYIERIAPLVLEVYTPLREPWFVLLRDAGFMSWAVMGLYLLAFARSTIGDPLVSIPLLASLGAIIGFLIQAKAWPYQAYPAVALMALALGGALVSEGRDWRRPAFGVACAYLILTAAAFDHSLIRSLYYWASPIAAATVAARLLAERRRQWLAAVSTLSAPAIASIFALAYIWFSHNDGPPRLQVAAAKLGPHPRIVAITQNSGVGHPFVRQIGGIWVQRVASLWITSGALSLLKDSKDPSAVAKLNSYLRLDRDMLVEDIQRNRPEIILISNRSGPFRDWAFADPRVAAELASYRLYADDGETFLYARGDLVAPNQGGEESAQAPKEDGER
jgi:hypothetical protein